jgi:hypothetical protein
VHPRCRQVHPRRRRAYPARGCQPAIGDALSAIVDAPSTIADACVRAGWHPRSHMDSARRCIFAIADALRLRADAYPASGCTHPARRRAVHPRRRQCIRAQTDKFLGCVWNPKSPSSCPRRMVSAMQTSASAIADAILPADALDFEQKNLYLNRRLASARRWHPRAG